MSEGKQSASAKSALIGILGHTGSENLGDESITQAAIENFSQRLPGVRFRLISINPDDGASRYDLPAYPLRPSEDATISSALYRNWEPAAENEANARRSRGPLHEAGGHASNKVVWPPPLKQRIKGWVKTLLLLPAIIFNELRFNRRCKAVLADMDMLVVLGSNQFLDNFGGPWAFPFTLLRWSWLASKTQTRVVFASVGAGPIYSPLSLWLIKRALGYAAYVSVRDAVSATILRQGGCDVPLHVVPDIAFSLQDQAGHAEQPDSALAADAGRQIVVGINPMPVYAGHYWYVANDQLYSQYVQALVRLTAGLQKKGLRVFYFATQIRDEKVVEDIHAQWSQMAHPEGCSEAQLVPCRQVAELQSVIDSADIIVATRFHATVLGLRANKPVYGVCYYRKAASLLAEFGLGRYAVELEDLQAESAISAIEEIIEQSDKLVDGVRKNSQQARLQLDEQYERLCAIATGETGRQAESRGS